MIFMSFLPAIAILTSAPSGAVVAPRPLTLAENGEIACIGAIATIVAEEKDLPGRARIIAEGQQWAGIAGSRIVEQSGQPRELVAAAMQSAAVAERERLSSLTDRDAQIARRLEICTPMMRAAIAQGGGDLEP